MLFLISLRSSSDGARLAAESGPAAPQGEQPQARAASACGADLAANSLTSAPRQQMVQVRELVISEPAQIDRLALGLRRQQFEQASNRRRGRRVAAQHDRKLSGARQLRGVKCTPAAPLGNECREYRAGAKVYRALALRLSVERSA